MNPPLIGITTYGRNADNEFSLSAEYVDAVRRAGAIPVLIPPGEAQLSALLERLDGLLLSGGPDVDPAHYAGVAHEMVYGIDPERDAMELALSRLVVEYDRPTLCICRGAQVMNVALGGTLVEHLPDVVGEGITHRDPRQIWAVHPVQLAAGSTLAKLFETTEVAPNSWHHQAIRQAATSLKVIAQAADGAIEAVEKPDHRWLIAVQWHPEATAMHDPLQQRLFDALVEAARGRGNK
ncbi:MAG: gamma-glutamyl-gamma-aminobutyrate hydrolase family protein [Caldilineaceae bacterium]